MQLLQKFVYTCDMKTRYKTVNENTERADRGIWRTLLAVMAAGLITLALSYVNFIL